jgi:hypothetical protein
MKWIVILVVALGLIGAVSLRSARMSARNRSEERHHRLDDSTTRRYPPTPGDEP